MDFFAEQERARRKTGRLVILLGLAVLGLIAMTVAVVSVAVMFMTTEPAAPGTAGTSVSFDQLLDVIDLPLVLTVGLVVVAVVFLGSVFKALQLKGGGRAVAESLGGRQINVNTQNADERKILNVVEEMAIASGTPVPPVYVLDDESINAFAAGYGVRDAVIGITRGTIEQLNRAELQGVVAHEFSHIMHGDMRLNIRLVSILHGILVIGLLGGGLLRSMRYQSLAGGRRSSGKGGGGAIAAILGLGVALMIIGFAGVFFGNMIKSAVSRQREFLADASAVQFTRDPSTIGGALKKIGGNAYGSQLSAAHAPEFSHLFFGQAVSAGFGRLLATHPPLEERIRRVEPGWDGKFLKPEASRATADSAAETAGKSEDDQARRRDVLTGAVAAGVLTQQAAQRAIAAIGEPGEEHLAYARQAMDELGEELRAAAHEPYAARALVYALLLSPYERLREEQLRTLEGIALPDVLRELGIHQAAVLALKPELRLPLVELCIPALKEVSPEQYRTFKQCLNALIRADGQVDLMEWALYHILIYNLEDVPTAAATGNIGKLQKECAVVLSVLARAGGYTETEASAALAEASRQLPFSVELLPANDTRINDLTQALRSLRQIKPLQKPALLKAMARCIEHNKTISGAEAELFRAVGEMLDCPLPPLLKTDYD